MKSILSLACMLAIAASASANCGGVEQQASCAGSLAAPSCSGNLTAAPSCSGASVVLVARRTPLRSAVANSLQRAAARADLRPRVRIVTQATGCGGTSTRLAVARPVPTIAVPLGSPPFQPDGTINECPFGDCPASESSETFCTNSAYSVALRSAQYRSASGIRGHTAIESGHTSGVGWASNNPQPVTCLGAGGSNYAVVRGRDGWYSTKIQ